MIAGFPASYVKIIGGHSESLLTFFALKTSGSKRIDYYEASMKLLYEVRRWVCRSMQDLEVL